MKKISLFITFIALSFFLSCFEPVEPGNSSDAGLDGVWHVIELGEKNGSVYNAPFTNRTTKFYDGNGELTKTITSTLDYYYNISNNTKTKYNHYYNTSPNEPTLEGKMIQYEPKSFTIAGNELTTGGSTYRFEKLSNGNWKITSKRMSRDYLIMEPADASKIENAVPITPAAK
ncbi:MAG: hypothetical protein GY754_28500 [bacterium]|nr:hypothetical protein [bacterium]